MTVKKILALLLAAMMVLGMTSAMAADDAGEKTLDGTVNTVVIPKAIVVTNPDSQQKVYTPNVTYKYTAAGVTTASTITDENGVSAQTKTGVAGGVSIADVEFTTKLTGEAVGANGYEIVLPINVVVTPSAFEATGAGIYRYTITESVTDADATNDTADLTAIGMTRVSGYDNVRTLDLYLKNKTGGGLELGDYVVSESSTTDITSPGSDTDIPGKNGGFIPGEDTTDIQTTYTDHALTAPVTNEAGVDWYHTFNVTLTKETTGTAGDKTKEFTFAQTVANNGYKFFAAESATPTAEFASGADIANTMKDGDVLYINGLNAKATVAYTETNNAPEEYKVTVQNADNQNVLISVDGAAASNAAEQALAAGKTAAMAATAITDYASSATAKASITDANKVQAVKYINKLDQISPTGVVLRFAPFLAMFAAGCVLFLLLATKRSKKEEE